MTGPTSEASRDLRLEDEPLVAVVGMAAHVPGAQRIDRFWSNLRDGVESIRRFTMEELQEAGVDPALLRDPRYVPANGVLEGMKAFDAGFFGLSPRDAAIMDPQTRHFLECVWHAMEDAGHVPEGFEGNIGVFAGAGATQYFWRNVVRDPELMASVGYFLLRHTGNDKDFVATRASYEFDLTGPSVGVQTACSTSLVAIHYACQSLLSWECDMALAGGVTIEQPHVTGYLYEEGEILSPDGHCRSYDAASMGTVFGSGAGVVALRRLGDAVADGDTIHAVIRGSAVNNDGAGKVSYLAPSVDGQAKAVTEAMAVAGVEPDSLGLIEGHGTGTPVGDPIEVSALTQAFRAHTARAGFCALGSVKSNIGHLDTAAGVASFIKAVLAVKHGEIPPTVHFQEPNPLLELDTSPFYVNGERVAWPEDARPRRAGVNSLGVGGTNAHVIVEEPPVPSPSGPARPWQLLPLSARSSQALEDASRQLMEALESRPDLPLADVSHTLRRGRRRFGWRRALVCRSAEDAVEQLATGRGAGWITGQEEEQERPVAFLFAGGGSQYPGMGRELYEGEPRYREIVDRCLVHMREVEGVDLQPLLFPAPGTEEEAARRLRAPSLALPALFTVQYAQARTWMSWGIQPSALLGHSMGEYTAACVAGVFSPEDALSLVALRGRLFETLEPGAMTSVQMAEDELRGLVGEELSIAAVNAPEVVVAAGPVAAVEALEERLRERDTDFRRIHIDVAAHSAMLEPILERFRTRVASMTLAAPELPLLSNLTGDRVTSEVTDPGYWVRHLRETVRFSDGVGRILAADNAVLLEIGPGRTLATLARMHPSWTPDRPTLSSLPHPGEPGDALAFQLGSLGALWVHGVEPDWASFDEGRDRRRLSLPGYPFQREDFFVEPPAGETVTEVAPSRSERGQDPLDWLQHRSWQPAPLPGPREDVVSERVLVLCDVEGPGARLADRLQRRGHPVVRVHAAGGGPGAEGSFVVEPGDPEAWRQLVSSLSTGPGLPDLVVHAWGLGTAGSEAELARSFFGPLHLIQALEAEHPGHALRLVAAATGVVPGGSDALVPERAALTGPIRVAPREIPSLSARLVAVDAIPGSPEREARALDRLADEIQADAGETLVLHRGAERSVETFVPVDLRSAAPAELRGDGAILITGGLGGLGLVAARVLARRGAVRLALLGRSGLPPRVGWDAWRRDNPSEEKTLRAMAEIEELERLGARVHVVQGDVTDPESVERAVREVDEVLGPVTGVVHTAGILDDGPLLGRERSQSEAVLGPKVDGVRALDDALGDRELELFWLFSSVSAVIGAPGQIDYAAANAVLDAFAHHRADRSGASALSLAWGAWRDVGMAAELAGETRYESATGSPADATPLEHPLFDRVRPTPDGETAYGGGYGVERHWMLAEHELRQGGWVLPGSGYVELIRAAVAERDPDRPFVLTDLVFLSPFRVGEGEVRELEVRLAEIGPRLRVSVQGRRPGGAWAEHASATVEAGDATQMDVEGLEAVEARIGTPSSGGPPEHPVMAFGPRWANVSGMATGSGEALLRHALPEAFRGDLDQTPLHPALLDMATAGATHLVEGVDPARDFLIPAGYGRLRMHGPLDARPTSHVRLASVDDAAGLVSFHVTVYDGQGRPAVEVDDFTMIRVGGGGLASEGEEGPDWLRDAIAPEEGEAVMELLLARATPPHLLISTRPVPELIQEAAAAPIARGQRSRPAAPVRVLLPEVMEALQEHPAVHEAAALGSPDDQESPRVVAFVRYEAGAQATVSELRRFLRQKVGRPWVPQNFVEVVALPRDADGAVEVAELRDPFAVVDDYVAPRTPSEETIAEIWAELLGLDRVGIHDNFLDVGGHSLVGIRVLLRIQQATGVRLEANALTMQTLEQLAADIDRIAETGEDGGVDRDAPEDEEGEGLIARVRKVIGDR